MTRMPRKKREGVRLPRRTSMPNGDETKIYLSRKREIAKKLKFDPDSVSPDQLRQVDDAYRQELKRSGLGNALGAFTPPVQK